MLSKNNIYKPTASGKFSGAGGMEIGLMQAGIQMEQSLDLDPEAIETMRLNPHYFGHKIIQKDIRDQLVSDQPDSDLIVGTYPCTRYSTIADIHGTRTGDDLFLHYFRNVAIKQPEGYIVENVPGMRMFPIVMEAMTKLPGYYINIFCPLDAANWLPQRRERLILIGTKKPFFICDPSPSTCRPRIIDIMEKAPEVEMPDYVLSRINGKYRDRPIIVDPEVPGAIAPCCVAHYAKDLGTRLIKDRRSEHGLRPFTIREYARLQGFPDDFIFPNKRSSYRLIGNAVAVPVGRWIGEQMMRYFN